jgi:hypothetical protein
MMIRLGGGVGLVCLDQHGETLPEKKDMQNGKSRLEVLRYYQAR